MHPSGSMAAGSNPGAQGCQASEGNSFPSPPALQGVEGGSVQCWGGPLPPLPCLAAVGGDGGGALEEDTFPCSSSAATGWGEGLCSRLPGPGGELFSPSTGWAGSGAAFSAGETLPPPQAPPALLWSGEGGSAKLPGPRGGLPSTSPLLLWGGGLYAGLPSPRGRLCPPLLSLPHGVGALFSAGAGGLFPLLLLPPLPGTGRG